MRPLKLSMRQCCLARRDIGQIDAGIVRLSRHRVRGHFDTIIADDRLGRVAFGGQV